MLIRFGSAVGRLPSLSLGRCERGGSMHVACRREAARAGGGKKRGIADNLHDEHLGAEKAEGHGEVSS